jgi:hypothetical protein
MRRLFARRSRLRLRGDALPHARELGELVCSLRAKRMIEVRSIDAERRASEASGTSTV